MSVAESFKSAKFADLPIQPSAAYLLAAPAVPDEARQVAIEKAEAGEEITFSAAKEIVAEAKKKGKKKAKPVPADKLGIAARQNRWSGIRERWNQKELAELAGQLRKFADGTGKAWSRGPREKGERVRVLGVFLRLSDHKSRLRRRQLAWRRNG